MNIYYVYYVYYVQYVNFVYYVYYVYYVNINIHIIYVSIKNSLKPHPFGIAGLGVVIKLFNQFPAIASVYHEWFGTLGMLVAYFSMLASYMQVAFPTT